MSAAAAEDTMVIAELWLSFGSMIRAYVAATSVNADLTPHVEASTETIRVTAAAARLEMNCELKAGTGDWQLLSGDTILRQAKLQLLPEGRIDIDGKVLDLDHAAIDLVGFVMNADAGQTRDKR